MKNSFFNFLKKTFSFHNIKEFLCFILLIILFMILFFPFVYFLGVYIIMYFCYESFPLEEMYNNLPEWYLIPKMIWGYWFKLFFIPFYYNHFFLFIFLILIILLILIYIFYHMKN